MKQSWRWFGPNDPVSLSDIVQAGATDIVTALHECYDGSTWSREDIARRNAEIGAAGLTWSVVESIPVPTQIKLHGGAATGKIQAFKATMRHLADQGLRTICYNFMPVVDWTRTDLRYQSSSGGLALRFDPIDFACYDLFVLEREDALQQYNETLIESARNRFEQMSDEQIITLEHTIIAGLPGSEGSHTRDGMRGLIAQFAGYTDDDLRRNLIEFLNEIIPLAEQLQLKMVLHPDDPPFSLFGLPRVLSCAADYRAVFEAVPAAANGITFCVGSLGVRADNDLAAMLREFGSRVHFAHLRNVKREENGAFHEAEHLDGSSDMIEVVDLLLKEEQRRKARHEPNWEIPMRPDHGHLLLDDIDKKTNPGYSAIGRLKGLAELRGVIRALEYRYG